MMYIGIIPEFSNDRSKNTDFPCPDILYYIDTGKTMRIYCIIWYNNRLVVDLVK